LELYSARLKQRDPWGAGVTLVEQSSFQPLSVPPRFPRNGDSPKHRAFSEVVKVNVCGSRGSQVLIEVPATAFAFREPGEVHLRRRCVLNHCMETDQGSIGMSIRGVVEREWRNLSSILSAKSLGEIANDRHLPVGWNRACKRQWRSGT
jgi:hypothetical protein